MRLLLHGHFLSPKALIQVIPGIMALVFLLSMPLNAQGKWEVAIHPGVNVPTTKFGDADLKTGFGGDIRLSYQLTNFLSAYTGWGWNHFNSDQSAFGTNVDYEETGYLFGLQFNYPTTVTKVTYIVTIGGLYNHIEAESAAGQIIGDTEFALGTQIGAGVSITLGKHFRLLPSISYKTLSTDFTIDHHSTLVDLKYMTAHTGFSYIF